MPLPIPRLVISAPGSSSGKTLVSLALCAWARRQGVGTAAFKVGPDYLDCQYLAQAAGGGADNLDSWMMGPQACLELFARRGRGAGLAVVEGAMGLFDGKSGAGFGEHSTASMAGALDAPVVLVADAAKAGPTLAASLAGLRRAGQGIRLAGVVLNRCSGQRHCDLLRQAIEEVAGLPVLGWLPELPGLVLPERHLGLTAASEAEGWLAALEAALPAMEQTLPFAGLLEIARTASAQPAPPETKPAPAGRAVTVAVARDACFHFLYDENLRLLEAAGARLAFFSPLADRALPEGAQALLLMGGFPELFGEALAANQPLRDDVRRRVAAGLPCWAECGGLMYLAETLVDLRGRAWPMAGVLPARTVMETRLQGFGYLEAVGLGQGTPLPVGATARGHEFHHSRLEWLGAPAQAAWEIRQGERPPRPEGWRLPQGVATYAHLHLASCPAAAAAFLDLARGR